MAGRSRRLNPATPNQEAADWGSPAFVGREDSYAAVTAALERGSAVVLIEGDPGIGKTRLLSECLAAESLHDRTVLLVACPPLTEPFPLGPVVDGVRRLRSRLGDLGLSSLAGALRPLFPEWAEELPPALDGLPDPKETRHRVVRALTELVERLGVDVLVVEDAHWADPATLEWLITLSTAEPPHRRSTVVTYRRTDIPSGSPLTRLISRPPTAMEQLRVELGPLDVEQTRQLVGSMMCTDDVSAKFAAFLHERTDGLPLALEETIRLWRERHDIVRHQGRWLRSVIDDLEVPPTIRDSVLERVGRLEREARLVLRAAAILAEPADEALLISVADLDDEAGRRGIARGLAVGLLRAAGSGRLAFRHALDARAVEEAMPASERWYLHRRAAQCLERIEPAPVARLARHFREVNDTDQWCRYGAMSADLALESGADRRAVTTLLELLTSAEHSAERRTQLARKLGTAAFFGRAALGDLAQEVVTALRGALAADDLPPGDRGEIRMLLGRLLFALGQVGAAAGEFEAAIPELRGQPAQAARAMLYLAMPFVPDCPAAQHRRWLDQATELLPSVRSHAERRRLMANRATVLLLLGDGAGWQAVEEMLEPALRRSFDEWSLTLWLVTIGKAATVWGRYDYARQQLRAAVDLVESIGHQRRLDEAQVVRAHLDWYTGDWAELPRLVQQLVEDDETEPLERLEARLIQGLLELATGDRNRAETVLGQVTDEYAHQGLAAPEAVPAAAALGRLLLSDGSAADALAATTPAMEMVAQKGLWLWATDIAPVHLEALVSTEQADPAQALVDQFAAGVADRGAPAPEAALAVCRGIVADSRDGPHRAAQLFADAASAWAAVPRPYDELLALERQGRCLLAAGERDDALTLLSNIEQRLGDLGAKWDSDRVAQLLRQNRVQVSRAWRRGRRGYGRELSPRELEVIALVARGMTNRQIAEALFVSARTVDRHLRSAMRKLQVSTRTALAMAATETGLISPEPNM